MIIKSNKPSIEGTHNGIKFKLERGILYIGSLAFCNGTLRAAVEIANLLKLEGVELDESFPVRKNGHALLNLWFPEANQGSESDE